MREFVEPIKLLAGEVLAGFFTLRMISLYGSVGGGMIHLQNYLESIKDTKDKSTLVREGLLKTINAKPQSIIPSEDFDTSKLNYLILYANLVGEREGDYKKTIYTDVFSLKASETFRNLVNNITQDFRNRLSHLTPKNSEDIDYIATCTSGIVYLRDFLDFLDSSTWNDNGKSHYIEEMRGKIDKIKKQMLSQKSKSASISISVSDPNNNIIIGLPMELTEQETHTVVASWLQSKNALVILLPEGEYSIRSTASTAGYELQPKALSVQNANGVINKSFVAESCLSDDDLFKCAFDRIIDNEDPSKYMPLLEQLNKSNHLDSMIWLAFLRKVGLYVSKNEQEANNLITTISLFTDADLLKEQAQKALQEEVWYKAVTYYIGFTLLAEDYEGIFIAGKCFASRLINYELCKRCFEIAAENEYPAAEKAYQQLKSIPKSEFLNFSRNQFRRRT